MRTLQQLACDLQHPVKGPITPIFMPCCPVDVPAGSSKVGMPPLKKEKSDPDPKSILRTTKCITARNLCAIDFKERNGNHAVTCGEFQTYWDGLNPTEQAEWKKKQELVKVVYCCMTKYSELRNRNTNSAFPERRSLYLRFPATSELQRPLGIHADFHHISSFSTRHHS
ncbi:hypothetical protein PAXRUDRAFT_21176 [Paxillus rubicundulus Ve08.2h10]|uniref:Uncharacterized protein n=1 Tax=Paxillus rubicundulus Ve08.2h10 TaxID=930991 RepID=A0A0D0CCC6_9AGAM|nr:hypothetical protein PAXRUDRAFT_21176 [Paxillus rubicundulus Ve08.2h10]